ncbi:MAG: hypothetical protein FWB80_00220 [Defluviitaleaceae bacterium]|nr:hypothetical protein [Defluviitaleaceae bacterium]
MNGLKQIYPIDEKGFIIWPSDLWREEPLDYVPTENEVDVLITTQFHRPRWDRKKQVWVEGGTPPVPDESTLIQQQITVLDEEINTSLPNVVAHIINIIGADLELRDHESVVALCNKISQAENHLPEEIKSSTRLQGEINPDGSRVEKSNFVALVERRNHLVAQLTAD